MASVCRPAVIATARSVLFGSGIALPKSFLSRRAIIIVSRPLSFALGGLESASPLHNAIASARLISNLAVDASCWSWLSQVLLVMFNKAALSSYQFPSANVITLLQMVCSTCLLYVLKRWKIITFIVGVPWSTSDSASFVPLEILLHTLPLSLAYLLYMLAGMESVRGVNVPMYTTLRRTTVVFTMIMEYLLTGQKYTFSVMGSVALIVFGAFVAGARDLSFNTYGYGIVFVSNMTTAVYLASIARIGKSSGLNTFGLMWCNGLVCIPVLFFWTLIRGDLELTINFPYLFSTGFQAVMLCSCILAFALNYSIFLNTTLNSAVTQTICGTLKDLFTIGLGWVMFGGLPFDMRNVIGQALGFLGSGFYAYLKMKGM